MKWTITMTRNELHLKAIVEKAIDIRITQIEGRTSLGSVSAIFSDYRLTTIRNTHR